MNSFLPSSFLPSAIPTAASASESDVLLNIKSAPKTEFSGGNSSFKKALEAEASEQAKSKRRDSRDDRDDKKADAVSANETSKTDEKRVRSEKNNCEESECVDKKVTESNVAEASNKQETKKEGDVNECANSNEEACVSVEEEQTASESIEAATDAVVTTDDELDLPLNVLPEETSLVGDSELEETADGLGVHLQNESLELTVEAEELPLENGVAVAASIAQTSELKNATKVDTTNVTVDSQKASLGLQVKSTLAAPSGSSASQTTESLNVSVMEGLSSEDGLADIDQNLEALKVNTGKTGAEKQTGPSTATTLQGLNMGLNERAMALNNERLARQSTQQWKGELIESAKSVESAVKTTALNPASQFSQQLNAAAETRVQMPVVIRFGQPGWAGMVAERSAMMAAQNIKFAELQLDPPELGPLQVKVTVNQEHAHVSFVTANANVREALDQTMPKLREMLEEQGLDLLDVDVSDQESRESEESDGDSDGGSSGVMASKEEILEEGEAVSVIAEYGVDSYA